LSQERCTHMWVQKHHIVFVFKPHAYIEQSLNPYMHAEHSEADITYCIMCEIRLDCLCEKNAVSAPIGSHTRRQYMCVCVVATSNTRISSMRESSSLLVYWRAAISIETRKPISACTTPICTHRAMQNPQNQQRVRDECSDQMQTSE
jgi:hypothetical protein